ncbi:helix-turn-helix transcriptional regulator [Sediminimonas sp.]|uniref:helix-turn-helix domain-containing protein n=1 Tax=Sediminimonas sp. TaxID=2823379 RepID=UPI0025E54DDC|nr:helix-turn-helix transcriptional regulator [Sediminimonas sp.]
MNIYFCETRCYSVRPVHQTKRLTMKVLIADLRRKTRMTQNALADAVGITRPYLSQIERGDRRMTPELKERIAKALGVDANDLVDVSARGREDEELLLEAFRQLSDEQQDVWIDMARAALRRA